MLTRRRFLSFLGAGIATAATPAIVEPVRKLFFVPSNAPVGSRIESTTVFGNGHTWANWDPENRWEPMPSHAGYRNRLTGEEVSYYDVFARNPGMQNGEWERRKDAILDRLAAENKARRDRMYMLREVRTREELAAMYPEPTDTLFGIEHGGFTEWLVARYTQTDAARLFRELTLSYANPEQASRFATRS